MPWLSGKWRSGSSWSKRAVLSCSAELSMPVGRAPRRASQADTDAVPDDVHAGDIFRQGPELGLRNVEDAPGDLVRRPRTPARFHVARRIDLVPLRAVPRDVVGPYYCNLTPL